MKKFFVLLTLLTLAFQLTYAKTCYSTGFESSYETQGWNFVNGSQTNKWMIGTGTSHNGSSSLYISSNNSSPSYSISSAGSAWSYKLVDLHAGIYDLSFFWKCTGESSYDYLIAYIVPFSSGLPSAGSTTVPSGALLSSPKLNGSSSWTEYHTDFQVLSSGRYYILFMWRADGSAGSNPPACIDDISISKTAARPVFLPVTSSSQLNTPDSCQVVFVCENSNTTWYAPYFYSANSYIKPESFKNTTYFNPTFDTLLINPYGTDKKYIWTIYKNTGTGTVIRSAADTSQCWGASAVTTSYTYTFNNSTSSLNVRRYSFTRYTSGRFTVNWVGMNDSSATQVVNPSYSQVYYYNTSYFGNGFDDNTLTSHLFRIYRRSNVLTFDAEGLQQYINCNTATQYVFDNATLPIVTINAAYASQVSIDGWYNEDGQKVGNPGDTISVTCDSVLTLKLIPATASPYTIKFDLGYYGSPIADLSVSSGFNLPSVSYRNPSNSSKMDFLGWYDNDGNYVGQAGDTVTVYSNLNLKAIYRAKSDPSQTYFKRVKSKSELKTTSNINLIFVNTYSASTYYAAKSYSQLASQNTSYNLVTPQNRYYPTNGSSTSATWASLAADKEVFSIDLSQTTSTSYDNNQYVWRVTGADSTYVIGYNGYWSSYANASKFGYTSDPYIYTRQKGYNGGTTDQYICRFNLEPSALKENSLIEWADWSSTSYQYFYYSSSGFRAGTNVTNYNHWDIYRQAYKVTYDVDSELSAYGSSITEDYALDSITLPTFNFVHADYANNVTILGWADENGVVYAPGQKIEITRNTDFHMTYIINKFTITFDAGDHGTSSATSVTSLLPFALPNVTTEDGYYFQGWASSINDKIVGQGGTIYTQGAHTLTYDDDLYAVYAKSYNVVEWGKNFVTVEFLNAATFAETRTTNGAVLTNTLSNCELDKGLYRLNVRDGDLELDEGLDLLIVFTDAQGGIISQASTKIPVIVSTTDNIASNHDLALCANTDLVILNGGVATAGVAPYSFKNIRIQAGGKLVIPAGATLTTENVYMTAGYIDNGTYRFFYPQFVVNGSLNNTSGVIMYDYWLNEAQYYTLTLPYDVQVSDIKYQNGMALPINTFLWIAEYNGAVRSTGASGWQDFNGSLLHKGKGYTVAATPQTVRISGGSYAQRRYAIARFPMIADLSAGETTMDKSISVTPYPSQTGKDNDAGWNLVGNPFLANYGGAVNGLSNNGIGLLTEDGIGGYEWLGRVRYVVIPNDNGTSYLPILAASTSLPAFKNFFVQIGSGDALNFAVANRAQHAPSRVLEEENNDICTGIVLSRNDFSDPVGFLIGDEYTTAYEINADLQKWTNTNRFNFYVLSQSEHLSFVAVNDSAANSIRLGYSLPEFGTYVIKRDTLFDNLNVDAIYLTDTKKNITTNLLTDDYRFSIGSAETNDNRFYVSIVRKAPGITTGLSNNYNLSCYAVAINGMLSIYNVPMGAYVSLYDLLGRKINSEISFSNKLVYRLPSNTYIVCIESGSESARLKVIVK